MAIGKFGARVLGKEEFEKQKEVVDKGGDKYGDRVTSKHPFGKRVVDDEQEERLAKEREALEAAQAKREAQDDADTTEDDYSTVKAIKDALEENPNLVDGLLEQEKAREGGLRITALRAFMEAETERDGGPRPSKVQEIEDLMSQFED